MTALYYYDLDICDLRKKTVFIPGLGLHKLKRNSQGLECKKLKIMENVFNVEENEI